MKKYEINRRYPFDGGACPVDGEAVVTVWLVDGDITSSKAKWFSWQHGDVTHFMVLEYQPEKKVRWVNVYNVYAGGHMNSFFYKTKKEADGCATRTRTACIRVEYMDGEGL